jgi:hypothetical protein
MTWRGLSNDKSSWTFLQTSTPKWDLNPRSQCWSGRRQFITWRCFKVGCLHPVACTRSGSGFPSNATLVWIFYSVTATCFDLMTIFRQKYMDCLRPPEDGYKTETCSSSWIKYSKQCFVRRKPWTWWRGLTICADKLRVSSGLWNQSLSSQNATVGPAKNVKAVKVPGRSTDL